jgi:hypothetical protein
MAELCWKLIKQPTGYLQNAKCQWLKSQEYIWLKKRHKELAR